MEARDHAPPLSFRAEPPKAAQSRNLATVLDAEISPFRGLTAASVEMTGMAHCALPIKMTRACRLEGVRLECGHHISPHRVGMHRALVQTDDAYAQVSPALEAKREVLAKARLAHATR